MRCGRALPNGPCYSQCRHPNVQHKHHVDVHVGCLVGLRIWLTGNAYESDDFSKRLDVTLRCSTTSNKPTTSNQPAYPMANSQIVSQPVKIEQRLGAANSFTKVTETNKHNSTPHKVAASMLSSGTHTWPNLVCTGGPCGHFFLHQNCQGRIDQLVQN